MKVYTYIFDSESIHKFKHCPYCGSENIQVSSDEFMGKISCTNCDNCNRELEFNILEEMISRFPKWWNVKLK